MASSIRLDVATFTWLHLGSFPESSYKNRHKEWCIGHCQLNGSRADMTTAYCGHDFFEYSILYQVLSQTFDEAEQKYHSLLSTQPRRRTALRAFEGRALEISNCPLRMACMTSIPAIVQHAAQNDLKPSMGRMRRLTALWSCSTRLLRYLEWRMTMAVLWTLL